MTLGEVMDAIPYGNDGSMTLLRPTAFGQVVLGSHLCVSAGIYQLMLAVHTALTSSKAA